MVLTSGDIVHTDNNLTLTTLFEQDPPLALWTAWFNPSGCNEAFAAAGNVIYRFNGTGLTDPAAGVPAGTGLFGNGADWNDMGADLPQSFNTWGGAVLPTRSGSNVYVAGADGAGKGGIYYYDGTNWSQESTPEAPGFIDVAIGPAERYPRPMSLAVGEFGMAMYWLLVSEKKVGLHGAIYLLTLPD